MARNKIHTSSSKGRQGSLVIGFVVATIVASGSYALTAANTVPTSRAGDGTGAVSGYTASNVHYNINALDPSKADSVQFTLNATPPAGGTLKARVVSGAGGQWYDCTNIATAATCTLGTGVTVSEIDQLRVVAAD